MIYNILNGDPLAYSFPEAKIDGEIIVVREGLLMATYQAAISKAFG